MLTLDIPTLLTVLGIAVASGMLALVLLWRENRDMPGLGMATLACLTGAAWVSTRSMAGIWPPALAIVVANFFLAFSFAALVEGMRRFYGRPRRWLWMVWAVLAVGLAAAWWTVADENVLARVRLASLLITAAGGVSAWIVWRGAERATRTGSGIIFFGMISMAVLAAPRTFVGRDFASPTLVNAGILLGVLGATVAGILGVFMVVAERHLATAEALRREAERNERSKAGFLAVMSHEIRTPMNGVLGLSEILLGTGLDAKQRNLALSIRSSGRILLRILDDVLDLSKIEAGRLEIETVGFKLHDLVDEVHQLIHEAAVRKGLVLGTDVAAEVPESVAGDPGRLGQVLLNLLGNAAKFTDTGRVDLRIRKGLGDAVVFEVEDTGVGMTPETRERVFRAFEQDASSTSRRFGGTGLGLSISKHLVELMGGRIEVESTFGEGSLFRVTLPLAEVGDGVPETDEIALRRIFFDELGLHPAAHERDRWELRILVAEDDAVSQLVASGMLEGLGVDCDIVADGEAALAALDGRRYDLVFMDCHMPKLDGFEATRRWRGREAPGERLPIIALTAGVLADEKQRCFEVGMDDVVTKPVSTEELAGVLERWLHVSVS